MKKRLLLAGVLFVFLGTAASAQGFHYGLKASLLFSTIQGKGLKSSYPPGFQGGAFAEWDLSKKWGIQPELLFTQATGRKGDDFTTYYVSASNTSSSNKLKLSYVTVPLLVRYSPIKELTFNVGAQYSYLFFANEDLLKYNRDAMKSSDIGAVAGVQVNVANVRFYGRYVLGLTNVNDIDNRYTWKSQQIAFGVGVAFK
ncbi:Outer membrane protein beta-barrel domain-containing protein [Chitinophaga sp. CF118]|uniref:porin family protein n=1 Tax=Chitinophaga sp. CF118 TaxID=1884367 RepID=UPI0008F3B7AA|nr:porin family protein [Chitinophaga sp. CF118]SFD56417.1 Outer membrane protein beta-barrel domain-containing protein [Chitinophaga sp. CF118]